MSDQSLLPRDGGESHLPTLEYRLRAFDADNLTYAGDKLMSEAADCIADLNRQLAESQRETETFQVKYLVQIGIAEELKVKLAEAISALRNLDAAYCLDDGSSAECRDIGRNALISARAVIAKEPK